MNFRADSRNVVSAAKCWLAIGALLGSAGLARAQLILDPPAGGQQTVAFNMHCCPSGYAMSGAHVGKNQFQCRPLKPPGGEDCFVDVPTQRLGMHACPVGTYLRGMHVKENLLTCCFDRGAGFIGTSEERIDKPRAGGSMHVCDNMIMTGIHVGRNEFLCAVPSILATAPAGIISVDPEKTRSLKPQWDATHWATQTRNWLARILNLPPNHVATSWPPAPTVVVDFTETVTNGFVTVTRQHVHYPSAVDGSAITAWLIFPQGYSTASPKTWPAVMVLHGHAKEAKDGPGKLQDGAYHARALYLAQNGFITLAPDTRSWGEFLSSAGHDSYVNKWPMGGMPQLVLGDDLTNVSVLSHVPRVDSTRLSTSGLSLGGWQAIWTAALDPRVTRTTVSGIFLSSQCINDPVPHDRCQTVPALWQDLALFEPMLSQASPTWRAFIGAPAVPLLEESDLAALHAIGLGAPSLRPLFVQWGKADDFYSKQAACRVAARDETRAVYDRFHQDARFRTDEFADLGHEMENLTEVDFERDQATDVVRDSGSTCGTPLMHCCPNGMAMIGAHMNRNEFLCAPVPLASPKDETCEARIASGGGALECPSHEYLKGIHAASGRITCCKAPALTLTHRVPDPVPPATATALETMHACPSFSRDGAVSIHRTFMAGIDDAKNVFLCAEP